MWEYSAGNRRTVALFWGMFVLANLVDFFEPLILAKAVNVIQLDIAAHGVITFGEFIHACQWLALLVLSVFAFWACHGPARVMEQNNAFLARVNYRRHMLAGILNFPMQWHVEHHTGDTIDKIEKGSSAIFRFSESSFEIIEALALLMGSFVALIYFNPHSAYLVISMALLAGIIVVKFDKTLVPQYRKLNKMENKISEKVIDVITNVGTIIILRVERHILKAIDHKLTEPFRLFRENRRISETKWFLVNLINSLSMVWVLASYIYYHSKDHSAIAIGTFLALYQYVSRVNHACFRFTGMYSDIVKQRANIANAEEVAREFSTQNESESVKLNGNWQKLEVRSLSFAYGGENGDDLNLDNISFDVRRGEKIALIGSTGSGKTTTLKIIRDLYDPLTLELYLDGQRLNSGFKAISSSIALIPQDPEILSVSVGENVTLGVECEMQDITKHTDLACFTDVALRLPNQFDSMVREKGVNLSGGEKQRLALARGLMASEDKSIVLFDEPTSSVDVATEQRIFENIFQAFPEKALICSLHSLHLLPLFDRVYMFENGKIIASGTFAELIASSPEFKVLWEDFIKTRDQGMSPA